MHAFDDATTGTGKNSEVPTAYADPKDNFEYYLVEKVLKYSSKKTEFLMKLLGNPGEESWVRRGNLQYNIIARYFKRVGETFPQHLREFRRNA